MLDPSYRKLPACRAAMRLVRAIYALTNHFPADEKSGLTATLKRAATSLPTKFAESHTQTDPVAYRKALTTAEATLRDLAAYLDVAEKLRMTSRRRFRAPRRRAHKVATNLAAMLDLADDEDARGPRLSWFARLSA